MLQEVHQMYREAFRDSDWLVRLELIYLLLAPAVLLASAGYLTWFAFNL